MVTTNCSGQYSNNQNTYYTSGVMNTTCASASSVNITFSASGNIESGFDFLFIEYSLNGGTTWINPYGTGTGWTGNFGAGVTIPAISVPTSSTFKFRFNFQSDFSNRSTGYKIYDFDITCNTSLPIELLYFDVNNATCTENTIVWATATETNNDYFIIEHSDNAIDFTRKSTIDAAGNSLALIKYVYIDKSPASAINYYRLTQVDYDGTTTLSTIIDIDNTCIKNLKLVRVTNMLGQDIGEDYDGCRFMHYSDGSIVKKIGK